MAFWNKEMTRTQVHFCWLADQLGPILLLPLTPFSESAEALTWDPRAPGRRFRGEEGKPPWKNVPLAVLKRAPKQAIVR